MIKSFELGSVKFNIKVVEEINEGKGLGRTFPAQALITVAKTSYNKILPNDAKEQTFHHELVHAILDTLGYYKLSNNEKFVQSFSVLLHQYMVTKK